MQSVCKTKWWKLLDENPNVLKTLKFVLNEEHSTLTFHFIIHHTIIISIRKMHFYVFVTSSLCVQWKWNGKKYCTVFSYFHIFQHSNMFFSIFKWTRKYVLCIYLSSRNFIHSMYMQYVWKQDRLKLFIKFKFPLQHSINSGFVWTKWRIVSASEIYQSIISYSSFTHSTEQMKTKIKIKVNPPQAFHWKGFKYNDLHVILFDM